MTQVKTFRKKPVTVEAVRFTGGNWPTVNQFVGKTFPNGDDLTWGFAPSFREETEDGVVAVVWDKLHETWVGVMAGQWIIRGVKGEFYPCDDEVFRDTYDEVEDPPVLVEDGRLKVYGED